RRAWKLPNRVERVRPPPRARGARGSAQDRASRRGRREDGGVRGREAEKVRRAAPRAEQARTENQGTGRRQGGAIGNGWASVRMNRPAGRLVQQLKKVRMPVTLAKLAKAVEIDVDKLSSSARSDPGTFPFGNVRHQPTSFLPRLSRGLAEDDAESVFPLPSAAQGHSLRWPLALVLLLAQLTVLPPTPPRAVRGVHDHPPPASPRGIVLRHHGVVQVAHRHPVRRVLESCHVEYEARVGRAVVRRHRAEVTFACLAEVGSGERAHEETTTPLGAIPSPDRVCDPVPIAFGLVIRPRRRPDRVHDVPSKFLKSDPRVRVPAVATAATVASRPPQHGPRPLAPRQARELLKADPLPPHPFGVKAATLQEHVLVAEEPPAAPPPDVRVDRHRVEHDEERRDAAVRRVGLVDEVRRQGEVRLGVSLAQALGEHPPPRRGVEPDERSAGVHRGGEAARGGRRRWRRLPSAAAPKPVQAPVAVSRGAPRLARGCRESPPRRPTRGRHRHHPRVTPHRRHGGGAHDEDGDVERPSRMCPLPLFGSLVPAPALLAAPAVTEAESNPPPAQAQPN
ncbi:hypothetical protein THAOC_06760, partial [Thalassiosira oceanica]